MSWTPISGTVPQYQQSTGDLASAYYLKFYESGTATAFNMATDSTGGTTLDKCQLDSSGYPTTDGSTRFIPHVNQKYKIVLYKNATDADNNTTGNADWVIDAIPQTQTGGTDAWVLYGATPTQTTSTTFTVAGDQTSTFTAGTRLKFDDSSTLYGIITASAYTTLTTVTVTLDSGSLSGSLSAVYTGLSTTAGKEISTSTISHLNANIATAVVYELEVLLNELPVSVKLAGAVGDGVKNDTAAIQAVINSVNTVYLPYGTYIHREMTVPSNRTIYSDGAILKRDGAWSGTAQSCFVVGDNSSNITNVTIKGLKFDINNADSFHRTIQLGQPDTSGTLYTVSNVRITDCDIYDTNPDTGTSGDKWGILFRANLKDIWIERCTSDNDMQLTAGATRDITQNINILNNRVLNGRANGIAISTGPDNHSVDGVNISGNYIEAKALCIFLGPDAIYNTATTGTWENINISKNICKTKSTGSDGTWIGIYLNCAPQTYEGMSITGNTISCNDAVSNQIGIRCVDENAYSTAIEDLSISGGTIKGCRYGIQFSAGGSTTVNGVKIKDCTDGVEFTSATSQCSISGCNITGGTRAITVKDAEVIITGNSCQGGTGQTGSFAGRLQLNPGSGETAKAIAIGNKFTDGASGSGANIFGVRGDGAGTSELHLYNNDLRGHTTAVSNITPDIARGNLNYVSENGGVTAAIATGATVTHGITGTPESVQITALASGPTDIYVTSIGSSTFTVNFGGGGSHVFAWEAKRANYF